MSLSISDSHLSLCLAVSAPQVLLDYSVMSCLESSDH